MNASTRCAIWRATRRGPISPCQTPRTGWRTWSGFSMTTETEFRQKAYYKLVAAANVSPARRRIADETMAESFKHFYFPCDQPCIVWFRESNPIDFDFVEDIPQCGQAVG